MLAFLLVVILGIFLWLGLGMHNKASLENLKESGFQVDYTLQAQGNPSVVFDKAHRRLAFIRLNKVLVYDYDQVLGWEWGTQQYAGWNQKSERTETPYLVFYLKDQANPMIRIEGFEEAEIKHWREQLPGLLPKGSPPKS